MSAAHQRFTIDGSEELERHLAAVCKKVVDGIQTTLPVLSPEAIILAGGYGRGQGGVLRIEGRDRPYNDLEFYVFVRGTPWLKARRHKHALQALGERLSPEAGVHVEFKIDSLAALRRRSVSMFSYDLVAQHRELWAKAEPFRGCEHHREPTALPSLEATRLLLNRCTGLLLAKSILEENPSPTPDQADFIGRNLAKLRLAFGDAVLTAFGFYHWNCLFRHQRLHMIEPPESPPKFKTIREHHAQGVEFKLHPCRHNGSPASFREQIRELSSLGFQLWVWLESRRLGRTFTTPQDYALSRIEKCRGTPRWCNYLLNLRTFGPKVLLSTDLGRYPRERLFNALPLLLWCGPAQREPEIFCRLQDQLMTRASDFAGWLTAYKQLWPDYG
jgi:hypothetical protein